MAVGRKRKNGERPAFPGPKARLAVRRVRYNGQIKWQAQLVYLSEVLAKEPVGLTQVDNELCELRFSFHLLGYLDARRAKIVPPRG